MGNQMPGRQGMELWRPDWVKVYRVRGYECNVMPDIAGELLTVTRETLRLALSALREQNGKDYYDNYGAAAQEIERVLRGHD
jgi:hypothetical protein